MSAEQEPAKTDVDVILVGGGLANCLIALWLAEEQPQRRTLIVEAGERICGNHTWSFHKTDLEAEDYRRMEGIISSVWPGQKVMFPGFERRLTTPYASIASESLRSAVYALSKVEVRERTPVETLAKDHVVLKGGQRLASPCIIDGRGFVPSPALKLGYQKFFGLELELAEPHGEDVPTIMDGRVDQLDGYRFIYVLPFSNTRVLVEDTRYSDGGDLDDEALRTAILEYVEKKGWKVRKTVREERGVLPITLAADVDAFWRERVDGAVPVGLRAGLFQPTTGYSLPDAVRVANLVSKRCHPLDTATALRAVQAHAKRRGSAQFLYRFLNRMLFRAAKPHERYVVLRRFYGLPQDLIERFYAGRLLLRDKIRILVGKPPLPIHRGLSCVPEAKVLYEDLKPESR